MPDRLDPPPAPIVVEARRVGMEFPGRAAVPLTPAVGKGPTVRTGVTVAIEPMVTLGRPDTRLLQDDWTVVTTDGSRAAHWEHTGAVTEEGPRILTL